MSEFDVCDAGTASEWQYVLVEMLQKGTRKWKLGPIAKRAPWPDVPFSKEPESLNGSDRDGHGSGGRWLRSPPRNRNRNAITSAVSYSSRLSVMYCSASGIRNWIIPARGEKTTFFLMSRVRIEPRDIEPTPSISESFSIRADPGRVQRERDERALSRTEVPERIAERRRERKASPLKRVSRVVKLVNLTLLTTFDTQRIATLVHRKPVSCRKRRL